MFHKHKYKLFKFKNNKYCFPSKYRKAMSQWGFTLIEMAVVLIIVGIVISMITTVLPTLIQSSKIKKAQATLEKVNYAIQGYITANSRLPFADNGTTGVEDSGTPTYFGNLPFITLGLSSGDDAWGNRIRYGVNINLTTTNSSTFPAALSSACTPFNAATLHINHQGGTLTNIAYVIVSGGPKDEDVSNGFFDGKNEVTDAEYDDPDRIISVNVYDDLMISRSCTEVSGSQGIGLGTPTSTSTGVENTDTLCSDTIDNDSDGKTDCHDQDCCGSGVTATLCPTCPPQNAVAIVTTPDPITQGTVGQTNYSHTFQATGGSGYYFWYLDSISPAISGLTVNLWSGNFSGSVNSCAGTYQVAVRAEDRYDSSKTNSNTFSFVLANDTLSISPVPSGGGETSPDFTVNASTFTQNFSVSGSYIGSFNWSISWVASDPNGFQIVSQSDTTAKFEKFESTTQGSYTFRIAVTDSTCSDNTFTTDSYTINITADGVTGPIPVGMESQWRFDECDTWAGTSYDVVDTLGDTNHYGKAMGSMSAAHAGKVCRAARFDGSDDKIMSQVLTGDDTMTFTNVVTLACWFKSPGGGGGSPRLVEFSDAAGSSSNSTALCYDNDGSLRGWVASEGGTRGGNADYSGTLYTDNTWHHAVYTYSDTNGGKLYVDGELKDTATDNLTSDIHDAETFVIGGYYPNNSHGFVGLIDEVMVYSRELTASEVSELYQSTRTSCSADCYTDPIAEYRMENFSWDGTAEEVTDSGTGGSNGAAANLGTGSLPTQTTASEGRVCRAGSFSRVDENNGGYLDFGDPADGDLDPGTSNMSISAWIKWNGSLGSNIIYNKENLYEAQVTGGYVRYAWQPEWDWIGGNSFTIAQDTWTYVTTVYDGFEQILYKDGVRVFSRDETGSISTNSNKFLIGARGSGSPRDFFGGLIDEVKIYKRALAENEINADKDETRNCSLTSVIISTTSIADGTINSAYSAELSANGGSTPYNWAIVAPNPVPGLSVATNLDYTGTLQGTTNVCAGIYNITLRVTDSGASIDEKTYALTVVNGTLSISPAPGSSPDFTCSSSTFYQDFIVSGPRLGDMGTWAVVWLASNDPGGFELSSPAASSIRFRKINTSSTGNYFFKITAQDSTCASNTIDSGYYSLTISGSGTDVPYYNQLEAEWRLDECTWSASGDVTDYSGNSLNGTAQAGADTTAVGKVCRAGVFDGAADYIDMGNVLNNVFGTGSNAFSVTAWIYPTALNAGASNHDTQNCFFAKASDSDNDNLELGVSTDGSLHLYIHTANRNTDTDFGVGGIVLNSWSFVAVTYDDGEVTVTINGTTHTDTTTWNGGSNLEDADGSLITIGSTQNTDTYFQGSIDEVFVYSRALSAQDIQTLYTLTPACPGTSCYTDPVIKYMMEENSWSDGSPDVLDTMGAYNGTGNNSVNTAIDGSCRAGSFDSSQSQYINCGNVPISGDITVSCWLKGTSGTWVPFHKDGCFTFIIRATDNISYADSTDWSYANFGNHDIDFTFDAWNHVVVSKTGSTVKIYQNGVLKLTQTFGGTINTNSNNLMIGSYSGSSYYYDGVMDEVIMWNRGLSESTIKNLYDAGRCAE